MALFFDLSIPYLESGAIGGAASSSSGSVENKRLRDARLRVVVKALELGYAGVAYDRPFRGVMADSDRCKISPFPLSSLLAAAPALAAAATFHRGLLGAPASAPFRQYSRITVNIDTAAAARALSTSNPLIRTYDIVAVQPSKQLAFDDACKFSEVDIITIDFSKELPFRLRFPSIEAAIKRGLHFEITYMHLIADMCVRKQMLSDVKRLVNWTRGKNLIISSAASTANEVRAPYDVANLSAFLLGLSPERAKAAISVNCRSLLAKALKKKHFYKETIRIDRISSREHLDSERFSLGDWIGWDPISSEGDLPSLEDILGPSCDNKQPFKSNAIDFASIVQETPFVLGLDATPISCAKHSPQSTVTNEVPHPSNVTKPPDNGDKVLMESTMATALLPVDVLDSVSETLLVPLRDPAVLVANGEEPDGSGKNINLNSSDSSNKECTTAETHDDNITEECQIKPNSNSFLPADANLSCFIVPGNMEPSETGGENFEDSEQCNNITTEIGAPNQVAELLEFISPGRDVQMSLNEKISFSNDLVDEDMQKEQLREILVEQQDKSGVFGIHEESSEKGMEESALCNQRANLIVLLDNMQSMEASKMAEVAEGEVNFVSEMDSLENFGPNKSSEGDGGAAHIIKPGNGRKRTGNGRKRTSLHMLTYPLPFKHIAKSMFFNNYVRRIRRRRR